jgi:release factor glutamine methyltransferase
LVEAATRRLQAGAAPHVLDLGVGSGAILLAVLGHFPKAIGVGVDINWVAAECARDNARRLSLPARILCGDWAAAIDGQFDLVFSNPPYIPEGEADRLAPEVVRFEDPRALFAGADGLEAFRRILPEGRRLLAPRGLMILEFGGGQAEAVRDLARVEFPGAVIAVENDLAGRPRALVIET